MDDKSETALGAAIETNLIEYLLSFGGVPGATVHADDEVVWIDAGSPFAEFNWVVRLRCEQDRADTAIARVMDRFRAVQRPFTWQIGPESQPPDLGDRVLAHGLTFVEEESGMAVAHDAAPLSGPPPEGLAIEPVVDGAGLAEWVRVWTLFAGGALEASVAATFSGRGVGEGRPWRLLLGRIGGKPVATAEIFFGSASAGVQHVVTVADWRRRGIGRAMTAAAMRAAAERGYRTAVLTSSPDGRGVYAGLGFREYCRFRRWRWTPAAVEERTAGGDA